MHGLWGTSLQNARSEAMRQTQQLHFSVTPAQLLGTTPQLPLSIIDETSAVGLICHSAGRSRRWAAAVVAEPADATQGKKDEGQAHEQPTEAKHGARSVTGLLLVHINSAGLSGGNKVIIWDHGERPVCTFSRLAET